MRQRAEFRLLPAAMLATPWAHCLADAERDPTDEPEPGGKHGQDQMQRVVDPRGDEDLLMPAPGAVSAYFVFSHLAGRPAASKQRLPQRLGKCFTTEANDQGESGWQTGI